MSGFIPHTRRRTTIKHNILNILVPVAGFAIGLFFARCFDLLTKDSYVSSKFEEDKIEEEYSTPLVFLVGPSGSGKTTISDLLEKKYGYKSVPSFTTRSPRYEGESGHTFISPEEFSKLKRSGELFTYTKINNNYYGATNEMVDGANLYVIDPDGVLNISMEELLKRHCVYIFITSDDEDRKTRLDARKGEDDSIARFLADKKIIQTNKIVKKYLSDTHLMNYYEVKNTDVMSCAEEIAKIIEHETTISSGPNKGERVVW